MFNFCSPCCRIQKQVPPLFINHDSQGEKYIYIKKKKRGRKEERCRKDCKVGWEGRGNVQET